MTDDDDRAFGVRVESGRHRVEATIIGMLKFEQLRNIEDIPVVMADGQGSSLTPTIVFCESTPGLKRSWASHS
jgi:hypothetical protein